MDRVPNAQIRKLCGVTKGVNERIDEGVLYVRECVGSCSLGRPRKRGIDTGKECLRKRGLDVRYARKMVQDRSEWRGFVRGSAWGIPRGMNPRP